VHSPTTYWDKKITNLTEFDLILRDICDLSR